MLYPSNFLRWLQRKRYQYEVTFSLYMLTPTEKFIFNSFLFLFLSMIIIAASLYLPDYISMIINRAFYYYAGDDQNHSQSHRDSVHAGEQQPMLEHVVQRFVDTSVAGLQTAAGALQGREKPDADMGL